MNDLTFPPTASKHRSLLLYEASGTISVVKLGLNMPRGVEQNTEIHRFLRQCSCNPKHLNAGAIDVIKWRETPTACGTPHSRVTGVNVRPNPGPWERHRRATWAESTADEAGQGEDCGALPHLPSGLQQRREGALRREPVQAGKEALGLGLWAPSRSAGSLSARPGGPAPDREPGTLPSSSSLLPLGVESRATAQDHKPQKAPRPLARRVNGSSVTRSGLGTAPRSSLRRARRRKRTRPVAFRRSAPSGACQWHGGLEEEEILAETVGQRRIDAIGGGGNSENWGKTEF